MITAEITRANYAYQAGEPGWYVVNHITDRAVAGPFESRFGASEDRRTRNGRWPDASHVDLVIVGRDA